MKKNIKMVFLIMLTISCFVAFSPMTALAEQPGIGIIGGSDGPTVFFSNMPLFIWVILIAIVLLIVVAIVLLVTKNRK